MSMLFLLQKGKMIIQLYLNDRGKTDPIVVFVQNDRLCRQIGDVIGATQDIHLGIRVLIEVIGKTDLQLDGTRHIDLDADESGDLRLEFLNQVRRFCFFNTHRTKHCLALGLLGKRTHIRLLAGEFEHNVTAASEIFRAEIQSVLRCAFRNTVRKELRHVPLSREVVILLRVVFLVCGRKRDRKGIHEKSQAEQYTGNQKHGLQIGIALGTDQGEGTDKESQCADDHADRIPRNHITPRFQCIENQRGKDRRFKNVSDYADPLTILWRLWPAFVFSHRSPNTCVTNDSTLILLYSVTKK